MRSTSKIQQAICLCQFCRILGSAFLKSPSGADWRHDPLLGGGRGERCLVRKTERKEESTSAARHEFFGYFMSLMRTHSDEAGDELPFLEPAPFRHLALVVEAYLFHMNVAELVTTRLRRRTRDESATTVGLFTCFLVDYNCGRNCRKPTQRASRPKSCAASIDAPIRSAIRK